jgi:hypothetical protein
VSELWRTGDTPLTRSYVYEQLGAAPAEFDRFLGVMTTDGLAETVVRVHNHQREPVRR